MSHEVIVGKDTGWMFHKPAWHRLFDVGKKRPKSTKEARKVSGITWDVESVPFITMPQLQQLAGSGRGAKHASGGKLTAQQLLAQASEFAAPSHRAIVRDDTLDVLGVWSDEGVPITNAEGFAFMDAVLGKTLFEALFSIRGGKQVCLLSEFPDWIEVGGDQIRKFLYTRLDHTGAGAMQTMCTNVRVQCANTDRMALDEASGPSGSGIYKVRHMGDTSKRMHEAREALKLSVDYSKQKIAEKKVGDVALELYPASSDTARALKSAKDRRDLIVAIFRGDTSHPKVEFDTTGNAPGTRWCAYNALVEYQQHFTTVRGDTDQIKAERRFVRSTEDSQAAALALVTAA